MIKSSLCLPDRPQSDTWVWGREQILWGFDPAHEFTFKILEPKFGREGCLSLQFHHQKSECWYCIQGIAWALVVVGDQVCTRIMRPNDVQLLPQGVIHRLMGCSSDCRILEPSTPDRHASDKSQPKDVVRLHCLLGRECDAASDPEQARLVRQSIEYTEDAIRALEAGGLPTEHGTEILVRQGAWKIPSL